MLFTLRNFDFCAMIANRDKLRLENALIKLLLASFEKASPKFFEGCPYKGAFYFPSFDPNVEVADLLPPIVPTGIFFNFY